MPSRLHAPALLAGFLLAGGAQAQSYCGRTVSFATQLMPQVKTGEAWVDAASLAQSSASFRISPDCQTITDSSGTTFSFGQESRLPNGTVVRMQREASSIAFFATDQRLTANGVAIVVRIDLSPRLLARNTCALAVRLAGSAQGGTVVVQNRALPVGQARVVQRSFSCAATPG